jgi:arylsulfatase B
MAASALVRLVSLAALFAPALVSAAARPPHIIMIVADDLGYNDISAHGSPQIPTPAIDALAREGVLLGNYHVQPVCSPSRSTFLSGRHVIHTGVYMPWQSNSNDHLNLSYSLLPTFLKNCCGYETVAVGKWHLGDNTLAALPVSRGFDASLGFWSGGQDYLTHWDVNSGGYDMMENTTIRADLNNTWTTEIFAQHAVDTIARFSPASDARLFMYLAFQNVHWPLMAPQAYIDRFAHTTGNSTERRLVCAMAAFLDDGIANVTAALKRAGIYEDTLIVLTSDNGGPTNGDEGTQSNNYPLRGGKNTLFEGGTRVVGLVAGAGVVKTGYTLHEKVHATDWLPSLVSMATGGRDFRDFAPPGEPPYLLGDGVDVWKTLSTGAPSPRDWLLLETHPDPHTVHGDAIIVGDWKIYRRGPEWVLLARDPPPRPLMP